MSQIVRRRSVPGRRFALAVVLVAWALLVSTRAGSVPVTHDLAASATTVRIDPAGRSKATLGAAAGEEGWWDRVGDAEGTAAIGSALQDTIWIADWSFDAPCSAPGWTSYDGRVENDSTNYWCVQPSFAGSGSIVGNAAVLAKSAALASNAVLGDSSDYCASKATAATTAFAYGNDWDYSIVCQYKCGTTGPALAFKFLSDSEPGFDCVTIECDSAGLSESRVNYSVNPQARPEQYRVEIYRTSGLHANGSIDSLALVDFTPGNSLVTHKAYIRFHSDGGYSPGDCFSTQYPAALVVDRIAVTGALSYTENFESALGCANPATSTIAGVDSQITFVNSSPSKPFGEWARVFQHVTDNDKCTENSTCAWLFTDPALPASSPDMAFGPGGVTIKNWSDNVIAAPWTSLASTLGRGTVLSFRWFPGNRFGQGKIVQGVQTYSLFKVPNTARTPEIRGGSGGVACMRVRCGLHDRWASLSTFSWISTVLDLSAQIDPRASQIGVGFRISDWQYIADDGPPPTLNAGPGPYLDRVRIGRVSLTGPVIDEGIDARSQAQDAFGGVLNAISPGEHHSPSTTSMRRFDAVPFDQGGDLGVNRQSPNLVTGDSIHVRVVDARGAGGITSVSFYGAIVAGPHAGKAPAPWTVGANGFFSVNPDTVRGPYGSKIDGCYFVDLDDTYFRGGDRLVYFWAATDAGGGFTSDPVGLTALPVSVQQAESATGGLHDFSALPSIEWAPAYLARIAADAHGDLDPTPAEIADSKQANCILYYNVFAKRRRGGDLNRTSFMYTLDRLGYRGHYDVYDVTGYGNTNNQLGSRATAAHMTGYALIVQDTGRLNTTTLPNGSNLDSEKINQAQWYRDYLASGLTSEIGTATLWIVGENVVQEKGTNALFTTDMGLSLGSGDQGLNVNPDVQGQTSFFFWNGSAANFTGDKFSLNGGCPGRRDYDGLTPTIGTGTHRYKSGTVSSPYFAIVMNKSATLHWNTILSAFSWFDIRDANCEPAPTCPPPGHAERDLLGKVLNGVLPAPCLRAQDPSGAGEERASLPQRSVLHQAIPNPFNPTTTIEFDLARPGHVELRIFDVGGRRVRTLVDADMKAGRGYRVVWNGRDAGGHRAPSGVYFCRLTAPDITAVRKMVLLQ